MVKKEIFKDIRSHCSCSDIEYCPLQQLLSSMSDRLAEQHKCVEIFKWDESQKRENEISWKESYLLWADKGYAKIFADVYKDGMLSEEIYSEILKRINQFELTDKDIIK